jgi:hypothetical protein
MNKDHTLEEELVCQTVVVIGGSSGIAAIRGSSIRIPTR